MIAVIITEESPKHLVMIIEVRGPLNKRESLSLSLYIYIYIDI